MGFNVNTTKAPMQTQRPKYEWPMLDEMAYQLEYLGSKNKTEKAFDDRHKDDNDPSVVWVPRIEFSFVLLRPGAHEAMVAIEAMEDTPERADALKTCQALKGLLNDGKDLTKEHVAQLVALVNALEGKDAAGNPTPELAAGTFVRPQFMCYIDADPAKQKNNLKKVNRRVPEDEMLPSFRPFARLADKREAGDDPTIVCEETGEPIHGYEVKFGDEAGKWLDNREVAKRSREKYGRVLAPSIIRRIKQAEAARVANTPSGAKAEELPF
jgi:hypothetical protein